MTWNWVVQALIMVVALWGWWDVEETIRSGDVVSDLARPFSFLGFWLARDYGRAAYYVLFRCLRRSCSSARCCSACAGRRGRRPGSALALSLVLAVAVGFAFRFMLNLTAFWTTDARGLGSLALIASTFLSGFLIPLGFFPDWLRAVTAAALRRDRSRPRRTSSWSDWPAPSWPARCCCRPLGGGPARRGAGAGRAGHAPRGHPGG